VVLESSVKPSLGKQFLHRLGLTEDNQDSRTTDSGCKTAQSAWGKYQVELDSGAILVLIESLEI